MGGGPGQWSRERVRKAQSGRQRRCGGRRRRRKRAIRFVADARDVQGPPAGVGVRNFGAWLDDASVMAPGSGDLTLSIAYWRTPAYREVDVPVVDGGLGLSRRVQFGFSIPYYHANEPGGPIARGVGDLYFTTKIQLREPSRTNERLGFR